MVSLAVLTLAACAPKSHEERVADLRKYYKAQLIAFAVEAEPVLDQPSEEPMDADGSVAQADVAAVAAVAEELAEGEEMPMAEEVPVLQNVNIEILLQHDSPEKLPGITLDVEMVDSSQKTKGTWKVWAETANLPKATGTQFSHRLEDVDYVVGDGFNVEVRFPVPPAERSEYREFSEPAGG
jgi:hypothetical protein